MASTSCIIDLDVGGIKYRTTKLTLTRFSDCMLAKLMQDSWKEGNLHGETVFIDRNGRPFEYVLDYLRNDSSTVLPMDSTLLSQIQLESMYYNLPGLTTLCEQKCMSLAESTTTLSNNTVLVGKCVRWAHDTTQTLLNSSLCEFYGLSPDFAVTCLDCDKTIQLFHVVDGAVVEDINRLYPSFVANQKTEKCVELLAQWRGTVVRQRMDGCVQIDWGVNGGKSFHVPQSALVVHSTQ